ncbi:UDP-GlcNAc:betaGal beta-1,3-N-acetylglucosaminyltransferase-like protein 1 isoform X1 [Dromiciops gliroides]|uniref:UDP-GlcNAc:betaGal beta-1,3-N-acetylglucosaminyltransferase-like protein 1 isoform X1 n=2 Tax=Dromiciops gliroides TaxID=33562 RepID=UPI001CC58F23|nr:UDP-GlcNAc:betaGal beta-1,3-N-acetylglucosaminyltransferase-like protein 1 isoform X1 [Dromiciops gliroides]
MWNSYRAVAAQGTLGQEVSSADRVLPVTDQLPSPSSSSAPALPAAPLRVQSRESGSEIQVSIILPVYNAECWLDDCLKSVLEQDFEGTLELSIFNDASKDKSMNIINKWKLRLETLGIRVIIGGHDSPSPRGVGFSKNQAIAQSSGSYLCFLDSDDVMMPQRVRLQYKAAIEHPNSIIGCQVKREPPNSTERYTHWINNLTSKQLITQVFTSYGPTVIMPTWFCSQEWFSHVGKFDESGKGVPEDLLFFYHHLRKGGGVFLVEQCLLLYRYHPYAATHSVLESTIWQHRVQFLEERALQHWTSFTIWNAGKQGRKLYRSLSPVNQKKVVAFCDVDENKIKKGFYSYEDSKERPKPKIPIRHFKDADPPFVICVKLDLTGGTFEENLESLNLQEGLDYLHFS